MRRGVERLAYQVPTRALDLGIRVEDFFTPGTVVQLGLPPRRVDVLTSISGIDSFPTAWDSRVERGISRHSVPFIGREALIANKRAAGRLRDRADIEALGGDV